VSIWDQATYENLQAEKARPQTVADAISAGHLEFALHGERLRGRFALVRMKARGRGKPQWLLIKMKDEFALPEGSQRVLNVEKAPRVATAKPARAKVARSFPDEVKITHPDKVMYPDACITKGDVFAYYERISDRLLPFLKDRPVTLERLPDGLDGATAPHFWQKNTPASYPEWIRRVDFPSEQGKSVQYALVNDTPTLLYLVNQGTLTFHVWSSRVQDPGRPDFVLFDLDPGEAGIAGAVEVARTLRSVLDEAGTEAVVKTSGKSGLHVITSWTQRGGYDEARAWARMIAEQVASSMPGRATVESRKAKRGGRVYIDVLQNARGHHAVPPYVLRAVPGAPVSTPLDWRELKEDLDPAAFNLKTIFRRLARRKSDPLRPILGGLAADKIE
jgi:bifunctional non-homologous end joining protein LigD